MSEERYPVTKQLREVRGVGPLTAAAFVLLIGDPDRFPKSRTVGSYVGLRPRQDQSGDCDRPLGITKAGSSLLRRLLVQAAQYMLGPSGEDCDLRRYGERIAARGDKVAKRKTVVAVARKLAVLLSRWARRREGFRGAEDGATDSEEEHGDDEADTVIVHDRNINQPAPSGRLRPCPLARGHARPFGRWQHPAGRTPKCTRRTFADQSAYGSMAERLVLRARTVAKSTLTNLAFSWKGQLGHAVSLRRDWKRT